MKKTVGIDIGTSSLKIVELGATKEGVTLKGYGSLELPQDLVRSIDKESSKEMSKIIADAAGRLKIKGRRAMSALPSFLMFSDLVDFPASLVERRDVALAEAIRREAAKYLPFDAKEAVIDWRAVQVFTTESGAKYYKVLLTAAPKYVVNKYIDTFDRAGLSLAGLETEPFALARSLVGNDTTAVGILDVGDTSTTLSVVDAGYPMLAKTVNFGGRGVTESIAESLGFDPVEAEQFKRDLADSEEYESILMSGQGVLEIEKAAQEIWEKYQALSDKKLDRLILTGGGAKIPGLGGHLENSLATKTFMGNPWGRVELPAEMTKNMDEIAPDFSCAVGLAMRDAN